MENAINEIAGILNYFSKIDKIAITNKERVTIFWQSEGKFLEKTFSNSIDLLEGCEDNLLPKKESKLARVIKYFKGVH
jgi:hypothetical protein